MERIVYRGLVEHAPEDQWQSTAFGLDKGSTFRVEVQRTTESMIELREPLDPHLDLRNHSPTGFSWGYNGSGPSQLALALLIHALGDTERAQKLYQKFKSMIVARWSMDQGWTISRTSMIALADYLDQPKLAVEDWTPEMRPTLATEGFVTFPADPEHDEPARAVHIMRMNGEPRPGHVVLQWMGLHPRDLHPRDTNR